MTAVESDAAAKCSSREPINEWRVNHRLHGVVRKGCLQLLQVCMLAASALLSDS
jgi:hypothetical protein